VLCSPKQRRSPPKVQLVLLLLQGRQLQLVWSRTKIWRSIVCLISQLERCRRKRLMVEKAHFKRWRVRSRRQGMSLPWPLSRRIWRQSLQLILGLIKRVWARLVQLCLLLVHKVKIEDWFCSWSQRRLFSELSQGECYAAVHSPSKTYNQLSLQIFLLWMFGGWAFLQILLGERNFWYLSRDRSNTG
jgi:hypothetical protein